MFTYILQKLRNRSKRDEAEKLIFEMFYAKVYRIAYYIVKDVHLAQDIVQETFVKAFNQIDKVKDGEKLEAWLKVIATTTAIDYYRKIKRRHETGIDNVYTTEVSATAENVETQIEKANLKQEIKRAIEKLDSAHREVLLLKYYAELKDEEIAEILNVKIGTVKSRIYRAKQKLKPLLERKIEEGEI